MISIPGYVPNSPPGCQNYNGYCGTMSQRRALIKQSKVKEGVINTLNEINRYVASA